PADSLGTFEVFECSERPRYVCPCVRRFPDGRQYEFAFQLTLGDENFPGYLTMMRTSEAELPPLVIHWRELHYYELEEDWLTLHTLGGNAEKRGGEEMWIRAARME
ncbi:MAG: hypothetical protein AAF804_18875, partial [Bacteroidota bacterium]